MDSGQAMGLVIAAASWKQISYNFLFFVAGLQAIPKSLLEAAAIDGAGSVERFWTIIFPLLAPTTFFLLVVNSVYALFDTFGIIHAVTGGGPGKATETLVYKVYNDGYNNLLLGSSSAQSVILMVIVITPDRVPVPLYRTAGALWLTGPWSAPSPGARWVAHGLLVLGVLIVAFPIYYVTIASTHSLQTILRPPLPLLPGPEALPTTATRSAAGSTGSAGSGSTGCC